MVSPSNLKDLLPIITNAWLQFLLPLFRFRWHLFFPTGPCKLAFPPWHRHKDIHAVNIKALYSFATQFKSAYEPMTWPIKTSSGL